MPAAAVDQFARITLGGAKIGVAQLGLQFLKGHAVVKVQAGSHMAEIVRPDTVNPRNGVDMTLHHGRQPLGGAALPEVGLTVTDGLSLDALGAEEVILVCQGLGRPGQLRYRRIAV